MMQSTQVPKLGGLRLAGAGLARLHVIGGVILGLGDRGGLLGLGEGAAVLSLDRPQTASVVRVGPRGLLDALRQLRRRRHWIGSRRGGRRWGRRQGVEAEVEEKRGRGLGLGLYISRRRGTCEVVNPSLRVERYGPGSWAAQPMYSVACLIQNNHLHI